MNYRFQYNYTEAQSLKWQIQAFSLLNEGQRSISAMSYFLAGLIQFCSWALVFHVLYTHEVPFIWMALTLFFAFLIVSIFYDAYIMPHVATLFDRKVREVKSREHEAIIEVDEEAVRTYGPDHDIVFKWDSIRDVHDSDKNVMLLTKKGYCLIPSKCFDGFLAKDAFVRACVERISGRTEQGAYFT